MAKPIQHEPEPAKTAPDAHDELERLLQNLHEHGVLRFANDVVATNNELTRIVVNSLSKPGAMNAMQNLSILLMALSRIEPDQFYKVVFAARDALAAAAARPNDDLRGDAPGITGALKLLHDEELWRAIGPLLGALKAFANGLDREVENPISAFSGKRGSP